MPMLLLFSSVFLCLSGISLARDSYTAPEGPEILHRDVVVIGGGCSGTHASVRLQQLGYSLALIENTARLGGHVNTFVDHGTEKTFDFGVSVFENTTHTRNYMSELAIQLVGTAFSIGPGRKFANFHTDGKIIKALPSSIPYSNATAVGLALEGWLQHLERFPFLSDGYNLPYPVPEDLLLTCGDFLKKYELGALANVIYDVVQGVGNFLAQPTLYIMKSLNINVTQATLGGPPLLTTPDQNNQRIYDSALRKLGSNVFLSSSVRSISRRGRDNVEVSVETPAGIKVIQGKKLLIAIEPVLNNLRNLGLDLVLEEEHVFGQLNHSYYWDMVIRNSGIPQNVSLTPIDLVAPLGIAPAPVDQDIIGNTAGIPDLTVSYFTSPSFMSNQQVQEQVLATLAKLTKANGFLSIGQPEFVGFHNHAPFQATVPAAAIRQGFYRTMIALQGERNTFFTGAAWQAHNSAEIWQFNDDLLLPQIIKSLAS